MAFESAQRSSRNRSSHSTTTKASQHDPYAGDSPPRTPPSRSAPYRSPQSERTLQPSTRETFLDDIGPTENARGNDSGDEPDPHDLALSPKHVTRTSIVDNMLLSLDQFAAARSSFLDDFGSAADSDPYELGFRYSTPRRGRGHTFSSSLSSDVEDDSSGRYSGQSPRGHRSNSSATFQPSLQRITSVGSRDGLGIRSQLASGSAERSQGGRSFLGRRGSNSSASSSVDFGQMNPGAERRSASFDYGSRGPFFPYSGSMAGQDTVPDDIDAAPMPTVPAGPRSTGDYAGVHNFPPPPAPALSRRNSNKSARSTQTRRGRSETLGHASIKGNDGDSKNFRESGRGLQPPMPPSYAADPCAPSPTIGFNKPILPQVDSPPGKERPGFFRRVFGSSKSSSPAQADYHHPVGESPYSREDENNVTPKSGKQTAGSGTPNRDSLPVVNKKPSFFRRRKKSVADNNVPPPIVLPQQTGSKPLDQFRPEPSPVASLRSVMKPYLGSVMSPIFPPDSKDYPGRDTSADQANDDMSGGERAQDLPGSPTEEYSSRPPHGQRRESAPARNGVLRPKYSLNLDVDHSDSFLADSSKNEGPNGKSSHKASSSRLSIDRSRRPKTSPEAPASRKRCRWTSPGSLSQTAIFRALTRGTRGQACHRRTGTNPRAAFRTGRFEGAPLLLDRPGTDSPRRTRRTRTEKAGLIQPSLKSIPMSRARHLCQSKAPLSLPGPRIPMCHTIIRHLTLLSFLLRIRSRNQTRIRAKLQSPTLTLSPTRLRTDQVRQTESKLGRFSRVKCSL